MVSQVSESFAMETAGALASSLQETEVEVGGLLELGVKVHLNNNKK